MARSGIPWDLVLVGGVGYFAYTQNWHGLKNTIDNFLKAPPAGGGGTPPPTDTTPMGYDDAIKAARATLKGMGWPDADSATAAQVKQKVCSDPTLFISNDPTSVNYKIRHALGCPL